MLFPWLIIGGGVQQAEARLFFWKGGQNFTTFISHKGTEHTTSQDKFENCLRNEYHATFPDQGDKRDSNSFSIKNLASDYMTKLTSEIIFPMTRREMTSAEVNIFCQRSVCENLRR